MYSVANYRPHLSHSFGQICNFHDTILVTCLYMYLIMNEEHFTFHLRYKHSQKVCDPIVVLKCDHRCGIHAVESRIQYCLRSSYVNSLTQISTYKFSRLSSLHFFHDKLREYDNRSNSTREGERGLIFRIDAGNRAQNKIYVTYFRHFTIRMLKSRCHVSS